MSTLTLAEVSAGPTPVRETYRLAPTPRPDDLDLLLEEVSPGRAVFSTHVRRARGGLADHPGVTLAEFALAAAIQSKLPAGAAFTVVELSLGIEAEVPARGLLRATAHARTVGRRRVLAEATVSGRGGDVALRASMLARVDSP